MIRPTVLAMCVTACGGDEVPSTAGIDASPIEGVCGEGGGVDPYADCVESFAPADGVVFGHDAMPEVDALAEDARMAIDELSAAAASTDGGRDKARGPRSSRRQAEQRV